MNRSRSDFPSLEMNWLRIILEELSELKPDPRMNDWLLMSSVWPTVYLSLSYIFIVKALGPWFMRNRRPYDIRTIIVLYNGFQVLFSAWLFLVALNLGWFNNTYSLRCQPVDYSSSENGIRGARSCWWYFISKFTELFDTLFFVLRKKDSHVTFLHAFHHAMMPPATWFIVRHAPGGHSTLPGLLNTFVHIIMYFYYMVAAMGPKYQKYIWWKKYLTSIQLIQFILIVVHSGQLLFINCDYPKIFALFFVVNSLIFLFLFSNFYGKSYKRKSNSRQVNNNNCVSDENESIRKMVNESTTSLGKRIKLS